MFFWIDLWDNWKKRKADRLKRQEKLKELLTKKPEPAVDISFDGTGFNVSNVGTNFIFATNHKWEWCIGGKWNDVRFNVDTAPNFFHRWMMKTFLGIHWRRAQ